MQHSVKRFWGAVIFLSTTWIVVLVLWQSSGQFSKDCNCQPPIDPDRPLQPISSGDLARKLYRSSAMSHEAILLAPNVTVVDNVKYREHLGYVLRRKGENLTEPPSVVESVRGDNRNVSTFFTERGANHVDLDQEKKNRVSYSNTTKKLSKDSERNNMGYKLILGYKFDDWLRNAFGSYAGCDVDACVLTNDTRLHTKADAVIFHICKLSDTTPPFEKTPGQVFAAYCLEPPPSYVSPYRSRAWKDVFNWTITYRKDSDIYRPYGEVVYRGTPRNRNYTAIVAQKSKTAVWFVSNCNAPSRRLAYVNELRKHIQVDIYGKCGPYRCSKNNNTACMKSVEPAYRFYLSFENSFCTDYVTEKLFKVYERNLIPVVRGGADYKKILPEGTYIDAADFRSPAELARHLKYLEANATAYEAILKRKDRYRPQYPHRRAVCQMCRMLHENNQGKTYPDFPRWVNEGACWQATDI
ncbi:hypothetical protein BaRGS_00028655 [Batillaria attramentaria]|uniref:Fucosyltransferase n=1 Tax=Batillaria attramentaria TaxID=370345 RepID=A0ABD0JY83_9CAEN